MASSADSWMKEFSEALKLADDINGMISERSSLPTSGPDAQRHASAIRRKITILGTRLDSLQSLLSKLPGKQPISEKEMNRRKDMLANLRSKVNQMASTLNMSNFANRDSLLGPEIKQADAMSRAVGLDNSGHVGLQRQIMREQDEGLEKLEETVVSTKHIALAVNEELDLHTMLIGIASGTLGEDSPDVAAEFCSSSSTGPSRVQSSTSSESLSEILHLLQTMNVRQIKMDTRLVKIEQVTDMHAIQIKQIRLEVNNILGYVKPKKNASAMATTVIQPTHSSGSSSPAATSTASGFDTEDEPMTDMAVDSHSSSLPPGDACYHTSRSL